MDYLNLIGRKNNLFISDLDYLDKDLNLVVKKSSFLVIGGAGSIGQAVSKEIFSRNPSLLHIVDISENNLVDLVRDIRSSFGYISGEFKTFAIDCGSEEFELLMNNNEYDYILNLSALKHVRSEKDQYTLMRMTMVNIFNTLKTIELTRSKNLKKYFCVSTDKAANPANMMGASKRIMEMFLIRESDKTKISMARFANVAFSDGSLLHGFNQRLAKNQPIAAPNDIKRYFITPQESGQLCLLSCIFGESRDIFFPKLKEDLDLIKFSEIAKKYLALKGYDYYECDSEEEAREKSAELIHKKKWPCYFFKSDTSGEKDYEEFFTNKEEVDFNRFKSIGIVKNSSDVNLGDLNYFEQSIKNMRKDHSWNKFKILELYNNLLPNFSHIDKGKYLDDKM